MASPGTDIAFSEARTEGYRAFANKIWNAARFLFMNIDRAREAGISIDLTTLPSALKPATNPGAPGIASDAWVGAAQIRLESRWILTRLSGVSASVGGQLTNYRFDEAANAIYQFFWGDLCDWYIEIVKLRLNFDDPTAKASTTAALTTLVAVFESALRLLSPFMPFITEEIWHALYNNNTPEKSIALTRFPQPADFSTDKSGEGGMKRLINLIGAIRARRKELGVPEKELVAISIVYDANSDVGSTNRAINNVYRENKDIILRLARVSELKRVGLEAMPGIAPTQDWIQAVGPFFYLHYERQIDIPAERERLTKDLAKYEKGLAAADRQLNNEAFMAKAPAHIVEGLRKQSAETKILYDKTRAALDSLPSA
jgi:valyl-tRNA synthetase